MRIILMGNAGAGKTTMASTLIQENPELIRLSLDEIAYGKSIDRRPIEDSGHDLIKFISSHSCWVMEGVYGDLIELALPYCDELRFLNPGEEICIRHCLKRPWEASKFDSADAQAAMLDVLLAWVKDYYSRMDETSLAFHQKLFLDFKGRKEEYIDYEQHA